MSTSPPLQQEIVDSPVVPLATLPSNKILPNLIPCSWSKTEIKCSPGATGFQIAFYFGGIFNAPHPPYCCSVQ